MEINTLSYEIRTTWEDAMNQILSIYASSMSSGQYATVSSEQSAWQTRKEAEVKAAGAEYAGGTMQVYIQNDTAAELTQERVYALRNYIN